MAILTRPDFIQCAINGMIYATDVLNVDPMSITDADQSAVQATNTPAAIDLIGGVRQALRRAGYKLTSPRLAVLDALEQHGGHLTAAELTTLIEQDSGSPDSIGSIGRATVFRTLDLLVQIGIVSKTTQGGSVPTYVLMTGGHHHHLICTHCQRVIEFPDCGLSPLLALLEAQFGFHAESHLLEVYGVCQNCLSLLQKGDGDRP